MVRVADSRSIAKTIRRKVLRSSERFWKSEDFEGDPKTIESALSRLVEAGELEHVRRGVYWRGRPTRFGMSVPPPVDAVRKIVGDDEAVGAAEWYATNLLGLSTQVAPVPVIAVSRRPPAGISGVRLVSRTSRTGRRDARLNSLEVTILEALDGWERYVEVDGETAVRRFLVLLAEDRVRLRRLTSAARTETVRVRERLRWLLEQGGHADQATRIDGARSGTARSQALAVLGAARDGITELPA